MRSNLRRTTSTRSEIQFRVRHSIPDFGDIDPFEVMRATKKRSNAYQIGQRYGSKITSGIYSFTRHPLDTISRIFSSGMLREVRQTIVFAQSLFGMQEAIFCVHL